MLNTCFWESGILLCAGQWVLMWPASNKNLRYYFTCCYNLLLEKLSIFYVTPLGGFFEFLPDFLWTSPRVPFSIADFALYPVTIVGRSHWNKYMLSCENEPYEFPQQVTEPEDGLRDLNTLKNSHGIYQWFLVSNNQSMFRLPHFSF